MAKVQPRFGSVHPWVPLSSDVVASLSSTIEKLSTIQTRYGQLEIPALNLAMDIHHNENNANANNTDKYINVHK